MSERSSHDFSVPTPESIRTTGMHAEIIDRVPWMVAGDKPFFAPLYVFGIRSDLPWRDGLRSMYEQGVRMFSYMLPLALAWDEPGGYNFTLLDKVHDEILDVAPEGLLVPRIFMTAPDWWDKENPDELIGFCGPPITIPPYDFPDDPYLKYETKLALGPNNASMASVRWREDAGAALAAYVTHTWEKYPGHFPGYHIAYGSAGEWIPFCIHAEDRYGDQDFSKPMVSSFRSFLREKYKSDEALQEAWNRSDVQLDTAEPPNKLEKHRTDVGVFKDPKDCGRYVDWVDHHGRERHMSMISLCRTAKQAAPVDVLAGVFAGYQLQFGVSAYVSQLVETDLDRLLESDAVDFLSTPNVYENRAEGVLSQAPMQTITRKKMFLAENDVRTFLADVERGQFSAGKDRDTSIASFKRDTFYCLSQGSGHTWWFDFGRGWYLDPSLETIVRTLVERFQEIPPSDRFGQAEVAVVLDEESTFYTEGSAPYFRLWRQTLNELMPRMGAPFDMITLEDMLQRDPYKLYLFRDAFYAPPAKAQQIRAFVEAAKASCAWFYAAGLQTGDGIDPQNAERLTRIKMDCLNITVAQQLTILEFDHPVTRDVISRQGTGGNDDIRGCYGPMLIANDADAEILGQLESIERPGIAYKHQEERFDIWFASPLLEPKLFANLAVNAGVQLFTEPGNVVYGSGRLVSLMSDETKTVQFKPLVATNAVEDLLSGNVVKASDGAFNIDLVAGDPVLLRLHEKL